MAYEIVIPRLGWSMEEGTFVAWLKNDGDYVQPGEPLFELEGEKASQEIEAVDEGILRIPPAGPKHGEVLKVGAVIGYLVADGERIAVERNQPIPPAPLNAQNGTAQVVAAAAPSPASIQGKPCASPRARRIASELGIDWTELTGTGSSGRICERDIRAVAAARNGLPANTAMIGKRIPLTSRRRTIAQRMVASRQQTVPVTLTTQADATNLVNLRKQFQSLGGSALVPSYQDIIVKLVAEALKRHLLLAARWDEEAILVPAENELHIGIAVDTDEGLLVPVIRDVARLSLADVAKHSRELIDRARAGELVAADMQGGVFTVTNLGVFGIDAFTPVINTPEAAILGLGAIRREPVLTEDDRVVAQHQITLSLTFDHRLIDGAPAARFLQEVGGAIANPSAWLLS